MVIILGRFLKRASRTCTNVRPGRSCQELQEKCQVFTTKKHTNGFSVQKTSQENPSNAKNLAKKYGKQIRTRRPRTSGIFSAPNLFEKDYWTTNLFLVDSFQHSNLRSLSKFWTKISRVKSKSVSTLSVIFGDLNFYGFNTNNGVDGRRL